MGSNLRNRRKRHDRFYRQAKSERYAARSVFKLQELDRRFRLLGRGQRVLDLGCRPGSWLQYAAERVGPRGFAVGLDRTPLQAALPSHTAVLVGDVFTVSEAELRGALPEGGGSCFQVVLSDMAPDTSGISFTDQVRSTELVLRALEIARCVGCPGGALVAKIFMGEGFNETLAEVKRSYGKVKNVRPEATRKESRELYLVATGLRPAPRP